MLVQVLEQAKANRRCSASACRISPPEPSADLNAWAAFCASVRGMPCKKGTPHCCDAPLFGQGSQTNGKQLPLKLLVLPRHRQPGVTAKSTQGSVTLRLGLRRIAACAVRGRCADSVPF